MEVIRPSVGQPQTLQYRDQRFYSIAQIKAYLDTMPSLQDRYQAVVELRNNAMALHEHVEEAMDAFYDFVTTDQQYRHLPQEDPSWQPMQLVVARIRNDKEDMRVAQETVTMNWGADLLHQWLPVEGDPTYPPKVGLLNKMRAASNRTPNETEARTRMERTILNRVSAVGGRGRMSSSLKPQATDFDKLSMNLPIELTSAELADRRWLRLELGVLVHEESRLLGQVETEPPTPEAPRRKKHIAPVQEEEEEGAGTSSAPKMASWKAVNEKPSASRTPGQKAHQKQLSLDDRMSGLSMRKEDEMSVTNEQEGKEGRRIVDHGPLGVFRYKRTLSPVPSSDIENLRRFVGCGRKGYQSWLAEGDIALQDFFKWLINSKLRRRLLEQVEMFEWHSRLEHNVTNGGYVVITPHTILQQLINMDVTNYVLNVAFRPDHATQLLAFPTLMRRTYADSRDPSKYLNLDLRKAIQQKGPHMLRTYVSLYQETPDSAERSLNGMHQKLEEWARLIRKRSKKGPWIGEISDTVLSKADEQALGLEWHVNPCGSGALRVVHPAIPRRSVSPWVADAGLVYPLLLAADSKGNLECGEGLTEDTIARAHRNLEFPARAPTEWSPMLRYDVPYRHPGVVEIRGCSYVGDALVGARSWKSLTVKAEVEILLGTDMDAREAFVNNLRERTLEMAKEALIVSEQEERRYYGEKSFYFCRDLERNQPTPDEGEVPAANSPAESSRGAVDMPLAAPTTPIETSSEGLRRSDRIKRKGVD